MEEGVDTMAAMVFILLCCFLSLSSCLYHGSFLLVWIENRWRFEFKSSTVSWVCNGWILMAFEYYEFLRQLKIFEGEKVKISDKLYKPGKNNFIIAIGCLVIHKFQIYNY